MTRYEQIKIMSVEEMAKVIVEHTQIDDYCLSDCDLGSDDFCKNPEKCCARWLMEEGLL